MVAARIEDALFRSELEETANLAAVSIGEEYAHIFDWLRAHDVNAAVVIAVMLAVAFFNMAAALLVLVFERMRMIGVLRTMGMTGRAPCSGSFSGARRSSCCGAPCGATSRAWRSAWRSAISTC